MVSTLKKTPLTWVAVWLLALAVCATALMATAQTARAASVTPTQVSGNPTCKTLLSPSPSYEIKVDPPVSGSYGPLTVTFSPDGKLVDFTSTVKVVAVFVKGGTDGGNFYDYRPLGGTLGDTGLKLPTDQQISHVSFCWNEKPEPPQTALEVSKTADATYDRTIKWNLEKSVDDDSHSGQAGDSFDSTWNVKATREDSLGNYKVTGKITINNPNSQDVGFSVTDKLDDGTMADVDCDPATDGNQATGTVPGNSTVYCDYVANPTSKAATSNNVQVSSTTSGVPGNSALAPVNWKENIKGDETVKLSDPRFDYSQDISASTPEDFPEKFDCSTDPSRYTNGKYSYKVTNTATLKGATTDLSANADVNVDCTLAALTASKTAEGSYDRDISWKLEKSVTPTSHSGLAGDSFTSNYTIKATKTVTEGNHKVTGQIVINNPASISQSFSVIDELDKPAGTMAKVDCNSDLAGDQPTATVPAGMTFVCTYSASTGTATLNTATVTAAGNNDVKATAPVSYKANVIGDESVTLSDPTYLSPQTISDTTTKTFPATFKCSTNPADYTNYQRTDIYNNIAYLKGLKTDLSSKASVTVKCRNPWQSETATGAGIRYPGTSNWFMYTPYQTTKVDLIAGQYYDAGDIYMTRPGDGNTYIKITLASGFRFANVAQNLKIQSFAKAPTTYVQPGNYKHKFTIAQGTNTYKAKISGDTAKFYGIHADVERYVP